MAHNEGAPALPSLRSMIRRLQDTGGKNAQNQPHLKLRIIIAVPEATYMGASSRVYDSASSAWRSKSAKNARRPPPFGVVINRR